MTRKVYSFIAGGLKQGEVRERIYRILGIASLLVAIGGSVILVAAFKMRMRCLWWRFPVCRQWVWRFTCL